MFHTLDSDSMLLRKCGKQTPCICLKALAEAGHRQHLRGSLDDQ